MLNSLMMIEFLILYFLIFLDTRVSDLSVAYDVVSRWIMLGVLSRATSETAKRFLDVMGIRTPIQIDAIQIYGGS